MDVSWILAEATFEEIASDRGLRDAMQTSEFFVQGADVTNNYGLDRRRVHHTRSAATLPSGLAAGDTLIWAVEHSEIISKNTPSIQIENLETYARDLATEVHLRAAHLIIAPAGSVIDVLAPFYDGPTQAKMLDLGIYAKCARYAGAIDIQAQQAEGNIVKYRQFVEDGAMQARLGNADVMIFAGLTTNSPQSKPDEYPTARQMSDAAKSVADIVDGFWVSVPPLRDGGTGTEDYAKAHRFFRRFYGLPA